MTVKKLFLISVCLAITGFIAVHINTFAANPLSHYCVANPSADVQQAGKLLGVSAPVQGSCPIGQNSQLTDSGRTFNTIISAILLFIVAPIVIVTGVLLNDRFVRRTAIKLAKRKK